jgi:hypothetical protein
MSRFSCSVLGCFVASTLALGAQTQSVPPTPSSGASGSTITVAGCLENAVADGSLGGTPLGTTATPSNAGVIANAQPPVDGFLLTGARPAGAAPVGTTGATAAAPARGADPSKEELKTYALEGNRDELAAHKGHRVEITGALAPPASSGANDPAAREFKTGVQRLRVQTIKMTAESCQEK